MTTVTVSVWWIIFLAIGWFWVGWAVRFFVYRPTPFGKVIIQKSLNENQNDLVSFQLAGSIDELYSLKQLTLYVDVQEGRNDNPDNDKD